VSIQNGGQTVPCGFSLDRNDFQSFDAFSSALNQQQQRLENGANFSGRYIEMRMRRVHLNMRTEGIKAVLNGYGFVVWMGENDTKTISVDANLFENGAKQLRFRLKMDYCGRGLSRLNDVADIHIYVNFILSRIYE